MVTIRDIATTIATILDLDYDDALATAQACAKQAIVTDAESELASPPGPDDTLTPEFAAFIITATRDAIKTDLPTTDFYLQAVHTAAEASDRADSESEYRLLALNDAIRDAIQHGAAMKDLVIATGLSRSRIYQATHTSTP